MDERYLYFAMADSDVFDVPWSAHETHPYDLSDIVPPTWATHLSGPWLRAGPPGVDLPPEGWKVHVAATVARAPKVLGDVARVCVDLGVPFKILRGPRMVRAGQLKYSPRSLTGKAATVYPPDLDILLRVVDTLAATLSGVSAPAMPGDLEHPNAPVGVRFGAFVEQWVEAPDGRTLPGAGAVADDRTAAAPEPPPALARRFARTPDATLPLTEVAVLHRSSAGGVYRGRLDDGRPVVVKEARHHTGLDGHDVDAVTRLHHERAALEALHGAAVAPAVIDLWRRRDADFLVVELVDGPNLATLLGRRHPDGLPWSTPAERAAYVRWTRRVCDDLRDLVRRMRERDVVHGDLQPANVVMGPDGPRLVDFEGATVAGVSVTGAIGTPGYVPPEGSTVDRDEFAVARVARVLEDPDALLLDRRPDLEARFVSGVEASLDRGLWRRRLTEGILARATPGRTDRLFPGGIEQFTTPLGSHDLGSGAAGVLLALAAVGHDPDPAHLDWLAAVPGRVAAVRGLLEGVDGIALALARLGRLEDAARLGVDRHDRVPRGMSWARGRSGVTVAMAELAGLLDDQVLRRQAGDLAQTLARDVVDGALEDRETGLLRGGSGVALALLRVGELLDLDLRGAALAALHHELGALEWRGDCLVALPGGRVRTGLAHGTAASLLAATLLDDRSGELDRVRAGLRCTLTRTAAPVAGLLDGLAGEVAALDRAGDIGPLATRQERLSWHCVPIGSGWSVLGAQRLRCSDDLATGSAGVLLALADDPAAMTASLLGLPARLGAEPEALPPAMTVVMSDR
ncbi:hypothetical protein ACOCJ5_07265 [Knoellia sp. CPCC 206450]|uniref:class III lanthionine synthetase LanKC N-terminal domain-containing protein n=1 Tax=Knoellia tibetensis TaxID=3404798 RepID=UPI003B42FA37